jgi:hypothetical protein
LATVPGLASTLAAAQRDLGGLHMLANAAAKLGGPKSREEGLELDAD